MTCEGCTPKKRDQIMTNIISLERDPLGSLHEINVFLNTNSRLLEKEKKKSKGHESKKKRYVSVCNTQTKLQRAYGKQSRGQQKHTFLHSKFINFKSFIWLKKHSDFQ